MHSDPSKLSAPPPGVSQDAAPDGMDPVLARRRLLLRGLGKGAAAAAALSPLASGATRSFKLDNPAINGDGYCSVSGFHSAVISLAPGGGEVQPCSAPGPQTYFETVDGNYSGSTPEEIRASIKALLMGWGVTNLPNDTGLDNLNTLGRLIKKNGMLFLNTSVISGGGQLRRIKASSSYPAGENWKPVASFDNLRNDTAPSGVTAADTLLYLLYRYQSQDLAYVVAAFLGCIREDGTRSAPGGFASGPIPFDAKYVADQYNSNAVAAVPFFKRLCGG